MKLKYFLPLFLLFQITIIKVLGFFPNVIEQYYSNSLYPYISNFLRLLLGKFPFSVGDILYGLFIIYLLYSIWISRKTWKTKWKDNFLKILSGLSIFVFLFHLLWGMNYYRQPLSDKIKIKRDYSDEALIKFTKKLIVKTNQIQLEISRNPNIKIINPYTQKMIFEKSQKGYLNLSKEYTSFNYSTPCLKKSLFSLPLTYMGFAGYLNPFTNESQINSKLPAYTIPNVMCHEMAHQIGYASESECNFIGFLACIKNDDLYFQYATCSNALLYCLENIYLKNEKTYNELITTINPGIKENFKESELFWKQYDTLIDDGFEIFYDRFLKINQQEEGMNSYSKFIDLLINFYGEKEIE